MLFEKQTKKQMYKYSKKAVAYIFLVWWIKTINNNLIKITVEQQLSNSIK